MPGSRHESSPRPPAGRLRRLMLFGNALPFSWAVALTAHAGLIAAGIALLPATPSPRVQVVPALGWMGDEPGGGIGGGGRDEDAMPILRPPDKGPALSVEPMARSAAHWFELPESVSQPPAPSSTAGDFPAGGTSEMERFVPEAWVQIVEAPPVSQREPMFSTPPGRRGKSPALASEGGGGRGAGSSEPAGSEAGGGSPDGASSGGGAIGVHRRSGRAAIDGDRSTAGSGGSSGAGDPHGSRDVSGVQIQYPPDALRRGWSGFVRARFDVDDRGRVVHIQLIEADPRSVFNEAVMQGLRRWRAPQFLWNTAGNTLPIEFRIPSRAR